VRLACVLIPDFPVAVERRRRPDLGYIVVHDGARVLAASSGLDLLPRAPLREARAKHPHATFLAADHARYRAATRAMLGALEQIGPQAEDAGPGCVYLDVSGLDHHYADPFALAAAITGVVQAATGLTPSVGIAKGKFVAHVAASLCTPGEASVVPPGRERVFLRNKSVALLPFPMETIERLRTLALLVMGDIAALPSPLVEAQFRRIGRRLWELTNGIDRESFQPHAPRETIVQRLEFESPVATNEALVLAGRQLLRRALVTLDRRFARRMHLQVLAQGRLLWERHETFREALSDETRLGLIVKTRLASLTLEAAADTLVLTLDEIGRGSGQQRRLITDATPQLDAVADAIRQIRVRYGRPMVLRVVEVDPCSRHPEERAALIPYDA
jgi:nucleotidyltransferase/DNA polymerase involved in DNA repair